MSVTAVVGAQWGDEGKGKLAHLLSKHYDIVLRFQGGSNAGHTVKVDGQTFKFKLIPSGMLHPGVRCLICDGVVLNPGTLVEELESLAASDVPVSGRLSISRHTHLVLPFHATQDAYFDDLKGKRALGTTRRGIGPAYADKYFRVGLRAGDMLKADFGERVKALAKRKNVLFSGYYGMPELDPEQVWAEVEPTVEVLAPLVADTSAIVRCAVAEGQEILCEGAQGTLLDIDYGTYPFVTSSHTVTGGLFLGTGLNWRELDRVIGVSKAYTTRVGAGPFPTEDEGPQGEAMREAGAEYGTVTGRPRRCGWLDLPLLRYATQVNGFTELALTKTDVLDEVEGIKVCVAYERGGQRIEWPDLDPDVLEECTPVYETLPGWRTDTSGLRREEELPGKLADYVDFIAGQVEVPVSIISVGADRDATIFLS